MTIRKSNDARTDDAIHTWRTAKSAHEAAVAVARETAAAVERARPIGGIQTPDQRLQVVVAAIAAHEAEARLVEAARDATPALDSQQIADGHPLAISADPRRVRAALQADVAEIDRLETELRAARARATTNLASAHRDYQALADERKAAGLPPPRRVPPPDALPRIADLVPILEAREAGEVSADWTRSHAQQMAILRSEETNLRAAIELATREREARRAAERDYVRTRDQFRDDAQRQADARDREVRASVEAEHAEQRQLAEAQRAREAVGQ